MPKEGGVGEGMALARSASYLSGRCDERGRRIWVQCGISCWVRSPDVPRDFSQFAACCTEKPARGRRQQARDASVLSVSWGGDGLIGGIGKTCRGQAWGRLADTLQVGTWARLQLSWRAT